MIRIFLVDDHLIMRHGLRVLLNAEPGMSVVGEADDGRDAIGKIHALRPSIVVMDIQMPNLNGIDATRQIRGENSETKIVCLSASNDGKFAREMLRAGAMAYVAKDAAFEDLKTAIHGVLRGETFVSPSVRDALHLADGDGAASAPLRDGEKPRDGTASAFRGTSVREREVLQLIAEGKSTKEVAMILQLSVKTVETHRRNLMDKLNLDSVAELTKYAIREGITSL